MGNVLSAGVEDFFNAAALKEAWSAQVEIIRELIGQKLKAMVETNDSSLIFSKRKPIWTLFPHAVFFGQCLWGKVLAETLRDQRTAWPSRRYVSPVATTLLDKPNSRLLDQVVLLASPHTPLSSGFWDNIRVSRWNAIALSVLEGVGENATSVDMVGETAVSGVEVSESVADVLLRIASDDTLRPQILAETWAWLTKSHSLSVFSWGRTLGTTGNVVRHIRGLGDIEILKSYFLLVWSEWDFLFDGGLDEMEISIRGDFSGAERWDDREELIKRLNQVLERLDRGLAYLRRRKPELKQRGFQLAVQQYKILEITLLEVHKQVRLSS